MANEEFGPLAALIGTWEGDQGVNVSYCYKAKDVIERTYKEKAVFNIVGDVDNGTQKLWVIDYTTAAIPDDDPNGDVFHTELGYWIWDPADGQVMRCFMVPRGSTILAGGPAKADATSFKMSAKCGDEAYGVLSNPYLTKNAKCIEYTLDCTIENGVWTYEEDTVLEQKATGGIVHHTDKNTLKKVG
jgi:hypothetical protein